MNPIAELHRQVDEIHAKLAQASAENGKPITCQGKGCCACCHEPVYCSHEEVRYLVEGLTEEQKSAVAARLKVVVDKAKASGIFDIEMPPVMQWLALELPCPLLENGLCIAYERRPVGCRSHMAVGPADWCIHKRLDQKYPMAEKVSIACARAIVQSHLKLGNFIINDNMLALMAGELLDDHFDTASAEKIVFE